MVQRQKQALDVRHCFRLHIVLAGLSLRRFPAFQSLGQMRSSPVIAAEA